jgi:hypothetical protein
MRATYQELRRAESIRLTPAALSVAPITFDPRGRALVIRRGGSQILKRPIFVIDTAGKSKEEMKAAAREALQRLQEQATKPESKTD